MSDAIERSIVAPWQPYLAMTCAPALKLNNDAWRDLLELAQTNATAQRIVTAVRIQPQDAAAILAVALKMVLEDHDRLTQRLIEGAMTTPNTPVLVIPHA